MFFKVLFRKLFVFILEMIKSMILERESNNLNDYCIVRKETKTFLTWETNNSGGKEPIENLDRIRSLCGQQLLTFYGPPPKKELIPEVTLIVTPSLLFSVGPLKTIKFIKDWKGDSVINFNGEEVVVVKYRTFFQRK